MTGARVAASLWSVDPAALETEARRLAEAGLRTWHWDRSDGSMAPAGGFTAAEARRLAELTGLASEAHLMLADPLPELDDWLDFCELVVVHVESPRSTESLDRIVAAGRRGALAVAPATQLEVLPEGTDVLVMSVQPGHGGASFLPGSLDRIRSLASARSMVGVDGGVTAEAAASARENGANWIVSGTAMLADPSAFLSG